MTDDGWVLALIFYAAIGTGAIGGIFFVFSNSVMGALRRLPPTQGLQAMQAINAAITTPPFLLGLVGTALVCAVLAVVSALRLDEPDGPLVLVASLLYFVGTMALTVVYHVPRNEALDRVDPASSDATELWRRYASGWTNWNHVRAMTSLAAAILFVVALS